MRITSVRFNDPVISDDDLIRNICDDKTSGHSKVLIAIYVREGTVPADRTVETISGNNKVTTFTHRC
jgi:hypothetical protein